MLVVDTPQDLNRYVGRELGPGDWVSVDQETIDRFADATGDHQWIHVDVERSGRELPQGKIIAHGYLTLSLVPRMIYQLYTIRNKSRGINYGCNRVRFTGPVVAGSRLRLRYRFKSVKAVGDDGVSIVAECTVEIEGSDRPALVAEIISLAYA